MLRVCVPVVRCVCVICVCVCINTREGTCAQVLREAEATKLQSVAKLREVCDEQIKGLRESEDKIKTTVRDMEKLPKRDKSEVRGTLCSQPRMLSYLFRSSTSL